jgi:hypothetical protein
MNKSYIRFLVLCCNDINIDCHPFTQQVNKNKIDAIYFSASLDNLKAFIINDHNQVLSQYQDNCLYFSSRKSKGGRDGKITKKRNKTRKIKMPTCR